MKKPRFAFRTKHASDFGVPGEKKTWPQLPNKSALAQPRCRHISNERLKAVCYRKAVGLEMGILASKVGSFNMVSSVFPNLSWTTHRMEIPAINQTIWFLGKIKKKNMSELHRDSFPTINQSIVENTQPSNKHVWPGSRSKRDWSSSNLPGHYLKAEQDVHFPVHHSHFTNMKGTILFTNKMTQCWYWKPFTSNESVPSQPSARQN